MEKSCNHIQAYDEYKNAILKSGEIPKVFKGEEWGALSQSQKRQH